MVGDQAGKGGGKVVEVKVRRFAVGQRGIVHNFGSLVFAFWHGGPSGDEVRRTVFNDTNPSYDLIFVIRFLCRAGATHPLDYFYFISASLFMEV